MRQITISALTVLIGLYCGGCDTRVPKVVNSQVSPDGRYVIWVTEEIGGLRSGVTSVHLTAHGLEPEPKNEILRSPECEQTTVSWLDNDTVVIAYQSIYGSFQSELRAADPKVTLVRNSDISRMGLNLQNVMHVPCDPL